MTIQVWSIGCAFFAATVAFGAVAVAAVGRDDHALLCGGEIAKVTLEVHGVGCGACSKRLRGALTKLDGVISVAVDGGRVAVEYDRAKTSEPSIREIIERHGFSVQASR